MNALGQLDQAFQSVKEFADQFSGSQEIRMMLVELLRAASREEEALEQLAKIAGDLEARGDDAPAPAERGGRSRAPPRRPRTGHGRPAGAGRPGISRHRLRRADRSPAGRCRAPRSPR